MVTRDFLFFDKVRHKTILADSWSRECPSQKCIHIRGPTSKNLKTSQFQILGEMVLSKIEVVKKFRKNFLMCSRREHFTVYHWRQRAMEGR